MLSIHEGFPIKKMALYGSAAFIVGFTGTLTMLREYVPQNESADTTVVHPSNKDQARSNVSNQVPKGTAESTTLDPAAPLAESTPAAASQTLTTRQATPAPMAASGGTTAVSGTMPVAQSAPSSTATAPAASTSPQPAASSAPSTTIIQQPAPTVTPQPTSPAPVLPLSGLQNTVQNTTDTATSLLP